jgi:hypothetical protein
MSSSDFANLAQVTTQIIDVREPVVSLSCCTWCLFVLVGLGPWLLVNGMLVESAEFVVDLPNGSEFPALFGGAVQLGRRRRATTVLQ